MQELRLNSLYISSREAGAGSMLLALGLLNFLKRRYGRVLLFRPLIFSDNDDRDLKMLIDHFKLSQSLEETRGIRIDEAEHIVAKEGIDSLMESVLERYRAISMKADFVLCMGSRLEEFNRELGFDLNIELAKNLSAPIAGIFLADREGSGDLEESFQLWSESISRQGAKIFLLCANRSPQGSEEIVRQLRQKRRFDFPIASFPRVELLERLSLEDIMEHIPLAYLTKSSGRRLNHIHSIRVGTSQLKSLLHELKQYELIITASDRIDLVSGLLLCAQSINAPMPGGIILCGRTLDSKFLNLLEGLDELGVHILYSTQDESDLLSKIKEIKPSIRLEDRRKIETALELFERHVDIKEIQSRLSEASEKIVTPAMFRVRIFEEAKRELQRILLPEIEDHRVLKAAESLMRRKVVTPVLIGSKEEIRRRGRMAGVDLNDLKYIDPSDAELIERFAKLYYEERKHKGISLEMAKDRISADKTLFATMALYDNRADGLVSGAIHSTRDTISPALKLIKTKEGYPLASSCFFMCLPTRVLVYADCAINLDPTADELAVIALETVETALSFGIEPRVAMLSYSTGDSGIGPDVDKVRRATQIVQKRRPDLPVVGPIQYDAAIDTEVAKIKLPQSLVAGHATILIFPDLDTGNIAYKAVQRSSGAVAVGPIMQGLRKPVNDLSRGCSVDDIIDTVAITAIQAQKGRA